MNAVFSSLLKQMEQGKNMVLVTVVSEKGSTPRGTGAQMLVGAEGRLEGTVGGGALEKKAEELALHMLAEEAFSQGRHILHAFLLRDHQTEGIGMVCGGDVTMLLQRVPGADPQWRQVTEQLLRQLAAKEAAWLLQRTDCGAPSLVGPGGVLLAGAQPEKDGLLLEKSGCLDGNYFILPLSIGERAVILGGGHCAFALVPLLRSVGFRVVLMDCRPEFAVESRFPDAERVICADYEEMDQVLPLRDEDYVVIMTHSHSTDAQVQAQVLRHRTAYVGALGSRRKIEFINGILREQGIPEEAIARVHSPIGIGIKAAIPEEIAVSIAGEMIYERALRREQKEHAD